MTKVLVGMSGGIDSSVAAYLLREQGCEVGGISFLMWDNAEKAAPACCSPRAVERTSHIARQMGIGHDVIDVRHDFAAKVVKPFVQAYTSGLTPNPCILCNRHIKFPYLIREAEKRGAEYVATGHYARIERQGQWIGGSEDPSMVFDDIHQRNAYLMKGVDPKKDQSYVLYLLNQDILGRLMLPLGDYTKNAVREIAAKIDIAARECKESQEICFIQERSYLKFIQNFFRVEMEPGPILNQRGQIMGTHKGIYGYTIGQRKGLGIASPEPLYVVDIDVARNTVYVGSRDSAKKKECDVCEVNWIAVPPSQLVQRHEVGSEESGRFFRATVKVRSTMKDQPATIFFAPVPVGWDARKKQNNNPDSFDRVTVVFDEPQWAPAPGQSAVFYCNDIVIGGGIIKRSV